MNNSTLSLWPGKDLLATDFQYSDDYALLAAHLMLDCCEKSGEKKK